MKRLYSAANNKYLYCHYYGANRCYSNSAKRDSINRVCVDKGFNILYAYELCHKDKMI